MRRPQGVLELVETAAIILAFKITLDRLQSLLHALQTAFQGLDLVPGRGDAQELSRTLVSLGSLRLQVLDDGVGGLVLELDPATQVLEVGLEALVQATLRDVGSFAVNDWLLGSVSLSLSWGWNEMALASGRFEDEFEDFERVGVLWCGGVDSKGVTCGQRDLAGGKANFVIHGDLEDRVGVLELNNRGPAQVAVSVITVSKCKAVDVAVGLVVGCSIVQETTNASALCTVSSCPAPLEVF